MSWVPGAIERRFDDNWRYYYNPYTFESGYEYDPPPPCFVTTPIFIGTMPIRTDLPVLKYDEIEIPGFLIWERSGWKMLGLKKGEG